MLLVCSWFYGLVMVNWFAFVVIRWHWFTDKNTAANSSMNAMIFFMIVDRKSTRLNSSHITRSRMPSSA